MHLPRRLAAPALLALAIGSGGCSAGRAAVGPHSPRPAARTVLHVVTGRAPWRLRSPVSRMVALADGHSVVLAGGLTTGDVSASGVYRVDVRTGSLSAIGTLPQPVHDAAGAQVGGATYVFGGGARSITAAVQEVTGGRGRVVAQLPQPRADLATVSVGGRVVLVGGYTGTTPVGSVLATTDGRTMHAIGNLVAPVRYPAVVASPTAVWLFGGQRGTTPTSDVQRIDPNTGHAAVVGHLPAAITGACAVDVGGTILVAGGRTQDGSASRVVYRFDPATVRAVPVGELPVAVANAGAAVVDGTAYLFGGENSTQLSVVQTLAVQRTSSTDAATTTQAAPPPFTGRLLIADRGNNRLLLVNTQKQVLWKFPSALRPPPPSGFYFPDDAFFIHHGNAIISNQEGNDTLVEVAFPSGQALWSYGHRRVARPAPGYLSEPDDAYALRNGDVVVADANNCRVVLISPAGRQIGQIGRTGVCVHNPPRSLGYPNGDTPLADGNLLISEVHGSWISEYTLTGQLVWTVQLPTVTYPSDPQQIGPDRYLVADYANPGGLYEFTRSGRIVWSYHPHSGHRMLNHPSLAEVLPSGLIATNDDYRDRVVIIDPRTKQIVWQYGHDDVKGRAAGYLNTPDGFDLLAPDGTTPTHPFTQ